MDPTNDTGVIYAEATDLISLPALAEGVTAWAVDTRRTYQRLPVTIPPTGSSAGTVAFAWQAPNVSDWAVALEVLPR